MVRASRYLSSVAAATSCASALFLEKSRTKRTTTSSTSVFLSKHNQANGADPIGSPLWDVTRVGVDLPKVVEEYKTTLQSGELKADGYTPTGCFPDNNLGARDLHGKSTAFEGPISVIKYEDVVGKTEQKPMTPDVCFEFCRRFDGVKFFGITNGSKCYCEPMFVVGTAGNTGGCKVACEGNPGKMCGGPDASSIFEMHDCPPKEKFSDKAVIAFKELKDGVTVMGEDVTYCAKSLVASGDALVKSQQQKGNTLVMKHKEAMTQSYKSLIADINALPFDSAKVAAALDTALGEYTSLAGDAKASDTETAMKAVELASDAASAALPELVNVFDTCSPNVDGTEQDLSLYTPISESAASQVCDGKIITPVSEVVGPEACAKICSETLAPTQCVGFQYYNGLVPEAVSLAAVSQSKHTTRKGDTCGAGYEQKDGDIPGWGEVHGFGGGVKVENCGECAELCSAQSGDCLSYECSPTELKCNLNKDGEPPINAPNFMDYAFCVKQPKKGLDGSICVMFSEISGVALYTKEGCEGEAMTGQCYVPKAAISSHELAVKSETLALDYCFSK